MQGPYVNRVPDFADIDLFFTPDRSTKDIPMKVGPEAVKRSVRNLVLTNYYERPFRSRMGANIRRLLFENMTPLTTVQMETQIRDAIVNYEPRVTVNSVTASYDPDRNGFNIQIEFEVINYDWPIITDIFLERIR